MTKQELAKALRVRLAVASFFERGWERAIEARYSRWEELPFLLKEKITSRWSLASAREIVARFDKGN